MHAHTSSMKSYSHRFLSDLKVNGVRGKEIQIGSLRIFLIVLTLLIIVGLNPIFSLLSTYVNLGTVGSVKNGALIGPLHTDGSYVKDNLGNIVVLRGVDYSFYLDFVAGMWTGIGHYVYDDADVWSETNLRANLAEMQREQINVIRVMTSVGRWKNNQVVSGVTHQQILNKTIQIAREYGIYIVLAPWTAGGVGQSDLPWYPAQQYITNAQDFVDWWLDVSAKVGMNPNVIYDLWNEPNSGTATSKTTYWDACGQIINSLRAKGDYNLVVFQWGFGGNVRWIQDWISQSKPLQNVVFSTHLYRQPEAGRVDWGSFYGVNVTDLTAMRDWMSNGLALLPATTSYNQVGVPVWIGETGAYCGWASTTGDAGGDMEYAFIVNEFKILNELQIGYGLWEWGREYNYEWANFATNGPYMPPLNRVGQALANALAGK